jgi:hypothetical protein
MKATFKTAFLVVIGIFFGTYIFNMANILQQTKNGNSQTTNYIGVVILCIFLLIIALVLSLVKKENTSYVKSFDFETKEKLEPYNKTILVLLMLSTLFLGLIYGLIQSPLFDFYIVAQSKNNGNSEETALTNVRKYQDFFILGQLALGYIFYVKVVKKIGYRQTILGSLIVLAILTFTMTFVHSYYFFVVFSFIAGLIFFQVFYI